MTLKMLLYDALITVWKWHITKPLYNGQYSNAVDKTIAPVAFPFHLATLTRST